MKYAARVVGEAAAAVGVAAVLSVVLLFAVSRIDFPAFGSSHMLLGLTSVGQTAAIGCAIYAVWARGVLARIAAWVFPSVLVSASLGIPLAATTLYLEGLKVDQEFRTQIFSRATVDVSLADGAFPHMASFYPMGWFWPGGRLAEAAGMAGWLAYKPWAIISLAMAASLCAVLWLHLAPRVKAVAYTLVTTILVIAFGAHEPYGAVVLFFMPALLVLGWHALNPVSSSYGRWAVVASGILLGACAAIYTLYPGVIVLALTFMCVYAVITRSQEKLLPLKRYITVGLISALTAAPVWARYVWEMFSHGPASGAATRYLPYESARLAFPMFTPTLVGALSLLGLLWMILKSSRRATALTFGVVACYVWMLASMVRAVTGATLLGFRMEVVIIVLLGVAGAAALTDVYASVSSWRVARATAAKRTDREIVGSSRRVRVAGIVLAACGAAVLSLQAVEYNRHAIDLAYEDTDGFGVRADAREPDSARYFSAIDDAITDHFPGKSRPDISVLSMADSFLAIYPYAAVQAITPHYANPLADFVARNELISSWEDAESPAELSSLMAAGDGIAAADVVITRRSSDGYALKLASDTYPNQPNVRRFFAHIPLDAVQAPEFSVSTVGPFSVIFRER